MNSLDRVIIFDFDGVFVDNFDFHKKHIEDFLGKKIDDQAFYELHSGNVYEDDKIGLEFSNFNAKKYCHKIHDEFVKLPLVGGMHNLIDKLQSVANVYIVSSGCEGNMRDFFAQNNICNSKCPIYGVETNPSKKEKMKKILTETGVAAENMIFVTDTLGDINEANSQGVASIAVTWGFQRIETLEEGVPFGFAYEVDDITTLIEQYFEM